MSSTDGELSELTFGSVEEELEYWKVKAMEYRARYIIYMVHGILETEELSGDINVCLIVKLLNPKLFLYLSLEEVRGEFDDYQESSRELEAELEAQLEQAEGNNKDLLSRIRRLEEENDHVKVCAFDTCLYICKFICQDVCVGEVWEPPKWELCECFHSARGESRTNCS